MKLSKIKWIYLISFIFSLHIAIPAYINSTFISQIISEKYVGLIFTLASLLTIVLLSTSSKFLNYFGNRRFTLILLIINLLSIVGIILQTTVLSTIFCFVIFLITNTLFFFCIDIFIEHFDKLGDTGRIRGFYLTIVNLAWLISPLIAVVLLSGNNNYKNIYIISFFAVFIAIFGLLFSVKEFKDNSYNKTLFLKTYRKIKLNKHLFAITIINFILQFFYALMIIYTPIYLNQHLNFTWDKIGVIFTIMLSPFVIFSPIIGLIIDKYNVSKKLLLFIGLIIMGISTMIISFISLNTLIIWAVILFITRIGASIIETTSDVYFFTHIKEEETDFMSIYRDMSPLSYVIAPIIGSILILLVPFKFIFLILGIIVLLGLIYVPRLKNKNEI